MTTVRVLWELITYRKVLYLSILVLWLGVTLMELAPGLVVKRFFDTLTGVAPSSIGLGGLVGLLIGAALLHMVLILSSLIVDTRHRFTMSLLLRRNLLSRILEHPGARALNNAPGEVLSTFRDDVQEMENAVDWTIDAFAQIVFGLVALSIMLRINTQITLLTLIPLVGVFVFGQVMGTRIKRNREASRHATERVTGALGEVLGSVQAIQVANAERHVIEHVRELNHTRRQMMVRDRLLTQILTAFSSNTAALGTALILLLSAQAIRTGSFSIGDFALFISYVGSLSIFTTLFGQVMAQYRQAGVSFRRMGALLQRGTPADLVAHTPVSFEGTLPPLPAPPRHEGARLEELEVVGLSYHYPSEAETPTVANERRGVENVSFRLRRGEFVVVTGRVGSGKTTLLRALQGLLPPNEGEIRWNGERVTDPAAFFTPPHSAYTPQVPHLFSHTLRENLLLGLPESESDLSHAIHQAVMEDDLAGMEQGMETLLGPKGVRLSGGQIQRTAAARMFVRQPDLLIFDDLSSALDVNTERTLWERLFKPGEENHRESPTCLVVSHRRPALRRADRIIVLQGGRVLDVGRLDELLDRCEEMRDLWQGESAEPAQEST